MSNQPKRERASTTMSRKRNRFSPKAEHREGEHDAAAEENRSPHRGRAATLLLGEERHGERNQGVDAGQQDGPQPTEEGEVDQPGQAAVSLIVAAPAGCPFHGRFDHPRGLAAGDLERDLGFKHLGVEAELLRAGHVVQADLKTAGPRLGVRRHLDVELKDHRAREPLDHDPALGVVLVADGGRSARLAHSDEARGTQHHQLRGPGHLRDRRQPVDVILLPDHGGHLDRHDIPGCGFLRRHRGRNGNRLLLGSLRQGSADGKGQEDRGNDPGSEPSGGSLEHDPDSIWSAISSPGKSIETRRDGSPSLQSDGPAGVPQSLTP